MTGQEQKLELGPFMTKVRYFDGKRWYYVGCPVVVEGTDDLGKLSLRCIETSRVRECTDEERAYIRARIVYQDSPLAGQLPTFRHCLYHSGPADWWQMEVLQVPSDTNTS